MSDEITDDDRRDLTEVEIDEMIRFVGNQEPIGDGTAEENDAVIQWSENGHSGPGWYIWSGEYPEEGSIMLTKQREPTARIAAHLKLQEGT